MRTAAAARLLRLEPRSIRPEPDSWPKMLVETDGSVTPKFAASCGSVAICEAAVRNNFRSGIDQVGNAFTGGKLSFLMLFFNFFFTTAQTEFFLLCFQLKAQLLKKIFISVEFQIHPGGLNYGFV